MKQMGPSDVPEAPLLISESGPGVALITLNRPKRLNALTWEMTDLLESRLTEIRDDPAYRVLILTGADPGFCSGRDLSDTAPPAWMPDELGEVQRAVLTLRRLNSLVSLIRELPQPVIAAVNGVAAGAGYVLALAADLRIGSTSARFVNGFQNVGGQGAEMGLTFFLSRTIGAHRAAELMLTARPVEAMEAERLGLLLSVTAPEQLLGTAIQLAEQICLNTPLGTAMTKTNLRLALELSSFNAVVELESRGQLFATRTVDAREKLAAFMGKRRPAFTNK